MGTWEGIVTADAEFAGVVHRCFTVRKHCTLATLRADGSPRISGIEIEFRDGQLWLGIMSGSVKALDLRRDPRLALHSPTVDPPENDPTGWPGEAKISGRAVESPPTGTPDGGPEDSYLFRIDIEEVVLTRVGDPADHLVITSWHPAQGVRTRTRR